MQNSGPLVIGSIEISLDKFQLDPVGLQFDIIVYINILTFMMDSYQKTHTHIYDGWIACTNIFTIDWK